MGKIRKTVNTRFVDDEEGFEYTFEPVEDTVTIKKTEEGYEVRYLVQDDNPEPPNEWEDDNLFLVNYHRSFDVRRDEIITKNDLKNWYRKDFSGYKEDPDNPLEDETFPLELDYYIFPLSCYVHSGVMLSLQTGNWNPFDSQGWDTSHVGAVLVKKKEFGAGGAEFQHTEEQAIDMAENLVETWNQYLSGDVYGIVKEIYNKEKEQCDYDACWGFYGHKYALEALKTEI